MERYCLWCGEPFDPIEGNDTRDFDTAECEERFYDYDTSDWTQTQLADYGRIPKD